MQHKKDFTTNSDKVDLEILLDLFESVSLMNLMIYSLVVPTLESWYGHPSITQIYLVRESACFDIMMFIAKA